MAEFSKTHCGRGQSKLGLDFLTPAAISGGCFQRLVVDLQHEFQQRVWVKDYYLANRPMVGGANVAGIGYTNATSPGYYETINPTDLTKLILSPVSSWLTANPTKRPQYVILFLDVPSRVFTNAA